MNVTPQIKQFYQENIYVSNAMVSLMINHYGLEEKFIMGIISIVQLVESN
jgi:hypothetical protein